MINLFRQQVFRSGVAVGAFAVLLVALIVVAAVRPWPKTGPPGPAGPPGPILNRAQIALLRWDDTGMPYKLPVGGNPTAAAFDGKNIWVVNRADATVSKIIDIDLAQPQVAAVIGVGKGANGIAFSGESIWVTNKDDNTLTRIEVTNNMTTTVGVGAMCELIDFRPDSSKTTSSCLNEPYYLAFDGKYLWITNREGDSVTRYLVNRENDDDIEWQMYHVGDRPIGVAFDGYAVWVALSNANQVVRIQARDDEPGDSGRIIETLDVGQTPLGLAFDGANVWVTNRGDSSVSRIRASDGQVLPFTLINKDNEGESVLARPVGTDPWGVAFDGANIWVANNGDGTVSKLRAIDGELLETIPVGGLVGNITFDGQHIWITSFDQNSITRR